MKVNFSSLRNRMIQEQLIPRGINDAKVLETFNKIPRDLFIPHQYLSAAYTDQPLPIGLGQTISQPYMVALMTQCLGLSGGERVLEIGTGCGYQTAVLAELAKEIYTIERVASLAEEAKRRLEGLDYKNIVFKVFDGSAGWPEFAPYDRIIVTAAASAPPQALIEQLKDNAKMVIPIGGSFSQVLTTITRRKDKIETEQICGCVFVPLVGAYTT